MFYEFYNDQDRSIAEHGSLKGWSEYMKTFRGNESMEPFGFVT